MPVLAVALISGKTVLECDDFQGNGAELRELAAQELRVSPERVKLLSGSREIENEETITDEVSSVTAMVGEGQELPDWCSEKMSGHFSFVEVPGVGAFPEGSEEIDLKLFGRMLMLAMQRFRNKSFREYLKLLKEIGIPFDCVRGFVYSFIQPHDFHENRARESLPNKLDLPKWRAAHWKAKAEVDRYEAAQKVLQALDERLVGQRSIRCYSRWETHEEGGKTARHRVYGLRHNYNGIEIDKVLDLWMEPLGALDRQASMSILDSWSWYTERTRRLGCFDGNDIRREAPAEEVAARFDELIHLLAASAMGREDAVWLKRHMNRALDALTQALMKETCLLAASAYNPTVTGSDEACKMILGRALKTMLEASACLELLKDRAREMVLYFAENRNDAVRVFGLELLGALFPEEQKALLEGLSASDWPHMRTIVDASRSNPSPPGQCEIPPDLPSPRRLVHKSLKQNPVPMPRHAEEPTDARHALFEFADPEEE